MAYVESGIRRETIEAGTLSIVVAGDALVRVIELHGELDAGCVDALKEQVLRATAAEPQSLVVDLSGLEFIDSTGVAALYALVDLPHANGGKFGLLRGSPAVQRTLELMGIDSALPFLD